MRVLIALVALLSFGAASDAQAAATWRHFGADRAYATRAAAIADAPRVLRQAGYPEEVIALLKKAVGKPGVRTYVTNGMKLDFMRSGKRALWRNVLVKFDKPPLAERMEYSAPAEEWSVDWEGTTWTLGIPEVCNNLYGRSTRSVPAPASCAEVQLVVPAGTSRTLRFTLIRRAAVPDFNCWGVVERTQRTGSPHDCDWCTWTRDGVAEMERRYGGTFSFFHTSVYALHPDADAAGRIRPTEVTIVLPLAAREGGVAVCVEVDGVTVPAYLILPDSWHGTAYRIPDDFFRTE